MPELFIITGSNGAGKSSTGSSYVPENIKVQYGIFDGDKLYMQMQSEYWNAGIKSHKECKKLALEFVEQKFDSLVEEALQNNHDFAYEGHFTNDATWDIPKKFKESGYVIHLIFLGLATTELSQSRVIARAKEGGHYVDPMTLESNFYGNLEKLDKYFEIFHDVQIIETSGTYHHTLCVLLNGEVMLSTSKEYLPEWFTINLKTIARKVIEFLGPDEL